MHLTKPIRIRKSNLKNYSFLIFLFLLLASCGKTKPPVVQFDIPKDSIIPQSQMVKMLADIHVLEAALQAVKKRGTNDQQRAVFYYNQFFSEYHMSEKRFSTNLANYQADREQFCKLYEDVNKELEKRISLRRMGNLKLN